MATDLKSITIDGVEMRNLFTDVKIGERVYKAGSNLSLSANVTTNTNATISLSEGGLYLINATAIFTDSVTGTRFRSMDFLYAGAGGSGNSSANSMISKSAGRVNSWWAGDFNEAKTLTLRLTSEVATTASGIILYAYKLARYPGLGGVILRRIKSICYRPLTFRKAVA